MGQGLLRFWGRGAALAGLALLLGLWLGRPAHAEGGTALARLLPGESAAPTLGPEGHLSLTLGLSQPVPWRARLLDGPPRLLLDFRELDLAALKGVAAGEGPAIAWQGGRIRPGWSRLVVMLPGPFAIAQSEMRTQGAGGTARLSLHLAPSPPPEFAKAAARPEPPEWALPEAFSPPPSALAPTARAAGKVFVLDPGHGGIDPGAERGARTEADLMLAMARALKEALVRRGAEVALTREADDFVPLEMRLSRARALGAGAFVSLHADALAEGEARGASVYTLADEATEAAGAALAERHDRGELLAGVDLSAQDDTVAAALMAMARVETAPRNTRLAAALIGGMKAAGAPLHPRPQQEASFSVLKSPDIPSALLEFGFLSNGQDAKNLADPAWRAKVAESLAEALITWQAEEARLNALRQNP